MTSASVRSRLLRLGVFWLGIASILLNANTAAADAFRYHGFYTQGYLYSNGNNVYGESTDGSLEYHEVGLGGQYRIGQGVHVAGQLLARDAGATDNGSVRTDYFYVDLRFAQTELGAAGFRLGRVRNQHGLYNATRDVLFTRPSILLPSNYFEGAGIRELLFSSDGLQFYGYWDHGNNNTEITTTFGRTDELRSDTLSNIVGNSAFADGSAELRNPISAQIMNTLDGGRWKIGLSLFDTVLNFTSGNAFVPSGTLDANLVTASLQFNAARYSLTSEYSLLTSNISLGGTTSNKSESLYVQSTYRFTPTLSGLLRYDLHYGDRDQPNETDTQTLTLGGRWNVNKNWTVAAEIHGIRGTNSIPELDNPGGTLYSRTELFVIMAGLRF